MAQHFIIDGYNVIRQDSRLCAMEKERGLQAGREGLLGRIAGYRSSRPSVRVTVVFDGLEEHAGCSVPTVQGMKVVFAAGSADDRIRKLIGNSRKPADMVLVTNDRELSGSARALGAGAMSVGEFMRLMAPRRKRTDGSTSRQPVSAVAASRINEELKKVWGIE